MEYRLPDPVGTGSLVMHQGMVYRLPDLVCTGSLVMHPGMVYRLPDLVGTGSLVMHPGMVYRLYVRRLNSLVIYPQPRIINMWILYRKVYF